jgi:DNA gyrase/topoisomerase IV subunit A
LFKGKPWVKDFTRVQENDEQKHLIWIDGEGRIRYKDFVNTDVREFSQANNERSIPSMIDGFKPSQRKILKTALMRTYLTLK